MKQLWIIIVACVGFVMFSAWVALFAYCLCHRHQRRRSNNNLQNRQRHSKPTKFNDDIEMHPCVDGLCQDTLKRASRKSRKNIAANQERPINTTTAVVNGGFVYDGDVEVHKKEETVHLHHDETITDNYPDIIAATEQSGVPDVVINTTEINDKTDSMAVPEYRKPTLKEKIDNNPYFQKIIELPDNHLLQETEKSLQYQTLLVNGFSMYDSLHKDRTSSLGDQATAHFKPVQRSSSAPSLVSKARLMMQKQKARYQISRSLSLNSIWKSDFENNSTMVGSIKTPIQHKKSKSRSNSTLEKSYQENTKFSSFIQDSVAACDDAASNLVTTKSDSNKVKETDTIEEKVKNELLSFTPTTVDANENLNFVSKEFNTDSHMQLGEVALKKDKITSYAGLSIPVLTTDPIDNNDGDTDNLPKEEDTKSTPVNGIDVLNFSKLKSTSEEPTAETANTKFQKQLENGALCKTSITPVSNTSSNEAKNAEEGKSKANADVKIGRSSHAKAIRTAYWADDGGAEIEKIRDNESTSNDQGTDNGKKQILKSQDLRPPTQQSGVITNLIDRFQEKQTDALHTATAKQRDERHSHVNEAEVVELKTADVAKEAEKIQRNENPDRNSESQMLIIQPEKKTVLTELLKKTKVIEHELTNDLPLNRAVTTRANPLPSQARERQFNFSQAPYTATGIGLNPVMSELLTRLTDNQLSKQGSSSNYEDKEPIPNSHSILTTAQNTDNPEDNSAPNNKLAQNTDNPEDNSAPNNKSVVPEAPHFVEPVSKWKSVASTADCKPTATTRKTSFQGPLRLDGGPAPITGAALVSIMPELQNRLKRISDQQIS